jgi:hypothetical protein
MDLAQPLVFDKQGLWFAGHKIVQCLGGVRQRSGGDQLDFDKKNLLKTHWMGVSAPGSAVVCEHHHYVVLRIGFDSMSKRLIG